MKKKLTWFVSSLLVLAAIRCCRTWFSPTMVDWDPHPFHPPHPGNDTPAAPEIDPRLAVEGLLLPAVPSVLVWEEDTASASLIKLAAPRKLRWSRGDEFDG